MESNVCPVCGNNAQVHSASSFFGEVVKCEKCGIFHIEHDIIENGNIEPKIIASMYYYLIHNILNHKPNENEYQKKFPHFIKYFNLDEKFIDDEIFVTIEDLNNIFPKKYNERIDKILLNLADLSNGMDGIISIKADKLNLFQPVFFIDNSENYYDKTLNIIDDLVEDNLIKNSNSTLSELNYRITSTGWERIESLRKKGNKDMAQDKIFIAICFDDDLLPIRKSIKNVISSCSCEPSIIDEKQFNGHIVPEIFSEIKDSKFAIADLTKHRSGVYYEAGYAEGLGKEVILTCRKSDFEKTHFDVAQKNTILWENKEDLEKKLKVRITETLKKLNK